MQPRDSIQFDEIRSALSDAADLLVPLASASVDRGHCSPDVLAWLVMVRDSFSFKLPSSLN
jgi:hypothetical protein